MDSSGKGFKWKRIQVEKASSGKDPSGKESSGKDPSGKESSGKDPSGKGFNSN
jgi:hypothetical protein